MIWFKNKKVLKLFLEISSPNYEDLLTRKVSFAKKLHQSIFFSIKWSKTKYRIIFEKSDNDIFIFDVNKREKVYKNNLITSIKNTTNKTNYIRKDYYEQ